MRANATIRIFCLTAVALLALAGCGGRTATPKIGLGDLPTSPAVAGSPTPTPVGLPTATPTTTGGAPHGGSTGTHSPSTGSSSSSPALTGVSVTLTSSSSLITPDCPYMYNLSARITVDRAIDVTFQFKHQGFPVGQPTTTHFKAAGTKMFSYPMQVSPTTAESMDDTIVVTGPDGSALEDHASFQVLCISRAGGVVATPSMNVCPYVTTFSVKVSVTVGPQESHYKWVFNDGSTVTGTLVFPGDGPQSQVVAVKRTIQVGSKGVTAAFSPNPYTDPGNSVKATCTL